MDTPDKPPLRPFIPGFSTCPLCRARSGRERLLEEAPTLEDILFAGLVSGIVIGRGEKLDHRWCIECRRYIERLEALRIPEQPS